MKTQFPVKVTSKGVTAKIHPATQIQNGTTYNGFMVVYWLNGKRKRSWRSNLADAQTAAEAVCEKISNGDHLALELTNHDRMTYLRAIEPLVPLGVELDVAAREYAGIVKQLPDGVTFNDLLNTYRRHNATTLETRTVKQVVNEMVAVKQAAKLSDIYLLNLECQLTRFANDFQTNIGDVSGAMIQAWLDALKVGGRTKQNYLRHISTLFQFAARRKYLPKDAMDEIHAVQVPYDIDGKIEIFTPAELSGYLEKADEQLIPFLVIGAFAGLRSSEIERLEWQDVKFDSNCIVVQRGKVKKRGKSRRIVPMLPNLKAWLKPSAKESGRVWPHSHPYLYELLRTLATSCGTEWKSNALRHSFVSYRVAAIKNVPQVAYECGNSPQIIDSNYRELVPDADAEKWFTIMPPVKARGRKLAV